MWFLRRRASNNGNPEKALLEAQEALKEVKDRDDEVNHIAQDLRNLRERNHFAEQLEQLMIVRKRRLQ